mgnify:CR=1 FL=1
MNYKGMNIDQLLTMVNMNGIQAQNQFVQVAGDAAQRPSIAGDQISGEVDSRKALCISAEYPRDSVSLHPGLSTHSHSDFSWGLHIIQYFAIYKKRTIRMQTQRL